jgi:hypothetical protein
MNTPTSTPDRYRFEELVDSWILGELQGEELREFESLVAARADWKAEAEDLRGILVPVRTAHKAIKAPAGLLSGALQKARGAEVISMPVTTGSRQMAVARRSALPNYMMMAASLVVGIAVSAVYFSQTEGTSSTVAKGSPESTPGESSLNNQAVALNTAPAAQGKVGGTADPRFNHESAEGTTGRFGSAPDAVPGEVVVAEEEAEKKLDRREMLRQRAEEIAKEEAAKQEAELQDEIAVVESAKLDNSSYQYNVQGSEVVALSGKAAELEEIVPAAVAAPVAEFARVDSSRFPGAKDFSPASDAAVPLAIPVVGDVAAAVVPEAPAVATVAEVAAVSNRQAFLEKQARETNGDVISVLNPASGKEELTVAFASARDVERFLNRVKTVPVSVRRSEVTAEARDVLATQDVTRPSAVMLPGYTALRKGKTPQSTGTSSPLAGEVEMLNFAALQGRLKIDDRGRYILQVGEAVEDGVVLPELLKSVQPVRRY